MDARSSAQAGLIAPGISVGSRVDERESPDVSGSQWVAAVAPQLTIGRPGPLVTWGISGLRSFESYSSAPTPQAATDVASLWLSRTPTELSKLEIDGSYLRSANLFYLAPGTPLPSGQTELASGSGEGLSSRGEADYRIRSMNYQAPDMVDGLNQAWSAAVFPSSNNRTRLLVRWSQQDFWLDHAHAMRIGSATAGYHRDHTPAVSSEFEVGLADTKDTQHGTDDRNVAFSAGVSLLGWEMGLPFDARARVTRNAVTTGMAQVSRSAVNLWVAGRWDRTLDAWGGLFAEPTLRDLFGLEVQDTVGGRTVAMLNGSYGTTQPRIGEGLRVENRNASASVLRMMQPWLTARVTYVYSLQREIRDTGTRDSRRSRAELVLTAAVP